MKVGVVLEKKKRRVAARAIAEKYATGKTAADVDNNVQPCSPNVQTIWDSWMSRPLKLSENILQITF